MMTDVTPLTSDLAAAAADQRKSVPERQQAFNVLVTRFQDMAFGCAYALLGNSPSAEDAVQEAFLSAWRCLPQLRDASAFPGWFKRIVVRCCRGQREHNRYSAIVPLSDAVLSPDDLHDVTAEHLLEREQRAQVRAAVASLPEVERLVVTLFYIGDYSRAEVAAFLGISPIAVKKRLAAARLRLKESFLTTMQEELHDVRPSGDSSFTRRIIGFTKLFSALVDSGKPLLATLDQIAGQEEDPNFQDVIVQVRESLAGGSCLSQALQPHPTFFSPRYIAIIREGEVAGELEVALGKLAYSGLA